MVLRYITASLQVGGQPSETVEL